MIKDHLSTAALIVGLALSFISLKQWFSAPAIDISASVESSVYKSHPSIQEFIDADIKDASETEESLKALSTLNSQNFTTAQISLVANLLYEQAYKTKRSFDYDARTFLIYKIDNSGDKTATNVALVNSLDGVALIDGSNKSMKVSEKEPIELGEIPPRSTKLVYFWTTSYYFIHGDKTFVKYSEGTVDVEPMIPLGGLYKHFHDYSVMYQFLMFAAGLAIILYFIIEKIYSKNPIPPTLPLPEKTKRRRRRTRSKAQPGTQSD